MCSQLQAEWRHLCNYCSLTSLGKLYREHERFQELFEWRGKGDSQRGERLVLSPAWGKSSPGVYSGDGPLILG